MKKSLVYLGLILVFIGVSSFFYSCKNEKNKNNSNNLTTATNDVDTVTDTLVPNYSVDFSKYLDNSSIKILTSIDSFQNSIYSNDFTSIEESDFNNIFYYELNHSVEISNGRILAYFKSGDTSTLWLIKVDGETHCPEEYWLLHTNKNNIYDDKKIKISSVCMGDMQPCFLFEKTGRSDISLRTGTAYYNIDTSVYGYPFGTRVYTESYIYDINLNLLKNTSISLVINEEEERFEKIWSQLSYVERYICGTYTGRKNNKYIFTDKKTNKEYSFDDAITQTGMLIAGNDYILRFSAYENNEKKFVIRQIENTGEKTEFVFDAIKSIEEINEIKSRYQDEIDNIIIPNDIDNSIDYDVFFNYNTDTIFVDYISEHYIDWLECYTYFSIIYKKNGMVIDKTSDLINEIYLVNNFSKLSNNLEPNLTKEKVVNILGEPVYQNDEMYIYSILLEDGIDSPKTNRPNFMLFFKNDKLWGVYFYEDIIYAD